MSVPTAAAVVKQLRALASADEVEKVARFFASDGNPYARGNKVMGVPIGQVFPVAKSFADAPLDAIETLLESAFYEVRMAAVAIMDFQARAKATTPAHRKALFELYLTRHDRINNWDLVDRAAAHVVGGHLADKPRKVLYELAKSKNPWERRTAIVATHYFIRRGEVDDTFAIAEELIGDAHELVQKAVGSWVREAGKRDPERLRQFLDLHAARMPAVTLRYATEKLAPAERARYRAMRGR